MKFFTKSLSAFAVAATAFVGVSPASAGLLDPLLQHKSFPECHDQRVLKTVIKRFNWAEKSTWTTSPRGPAE